jgi:hypothetical protein
VNTPSWTPRGACEWVRPPRATPAGQRRRPPLGSAIKRDWEPHLSRPRLPPKRPCNTGDCVINQNGAVWRRFLRGVSRRILENSRNSPPNEAKILASGADFLRNRPDVSRGLRREASEAVSRSRHVFWPRGPAVAAVHAARLAALIAPPSWGAGTCAGNRRASCRQAAGTGAGRKRHPRSRRPAPPARPASTGSPAAAWPPRCAMSGRRPAASSRSRPGTAGRKCASAGSNAAPAR